MSQVWKSLPNRLIGLGEFNLYRVQRLILHEITLEEVVGIDYARCFLFGYLYKVIGIFVPRLQLGGKPIEFVFQSAIFGCLRDIFHLQDQAIRGYVELLLLLLEVLHDSAILSDFDVPTLLIVDFNCFKPLGLERTKLDGIIHGFLKALRLDPI